MCRILARPKFWRAKVLFFFFLRRRTTSVFSRLSGHLTGHLSGKGSFVSHKMARRVLACRMEMHLCNNN